MKLPKAYNPSDYESDIYELWESGRVFEPRGKGKHYSIVAPPPNANARLHLGYGLTMALEDIAIRYHRLKGESALFVPGADHAGFETWVVYEKKLSEQGKSRFDFSREDLYRQVWDFVSENRETFNRQFRKLGASVDWQHFTFTLDEKVVKQAHATFKKMWNESLIYRGERLVNFCTYHGTAFADIEVEYREEEGKLWQISYPLTDDSGEIVVATTRPETMLGDTAVAVNPKDERYKSYVGKTVKLPLTSREIPIIADEFVDINFGTGAVKITPAHDTNDFEIGQRHDLPQITVISHDGKITHDAPERYVNLPVNAAREKIVNELKEQGRLVKEESYTHSVGHCYKCGTIIEPLLMDQWFVDMQPLARPAIEALRAGKLTFFPASKKDQLVNYLEGLKDWNISRQIAWGIPIPAFQNADDPDDWIFDERTDQEFIEVNSKTYRRDPDVFDTWFSSSSWPYVTLDFPTSQDFKNFYPLSLMETGGEILYPWVSRMLMLGLYTTGEVPFKAVYVHGYVMAEDGSKMSKSKGNVIDLENVIDEYGSDALRMGIIAGRQAAVNRGYDHRKVEEARNFCNKLWNIARFAEELFEPNANAEPKSPADHWILSKLQQSQQEIFEDLDKYNFAEAHDKLYHFVWDDLADWYIETSKTQLNAGLLYKVLETTLALAHPFAPFVTEVIWQTQHAEDNTILASQTIPELPKPDEDNAQAFDEIKLIITEARAILRNLKVNDITLYFKKASAISQNAALIKQMAGLAAVTEVDDGLGVKLTGTNLDCWLDIDPATAQKYANELTAKINEQQNEIKKLEGRLTNKSYLKNAPKEIVSQTKQQLKEAKTQLTKLQTERTRFN